MKTIKLITVLISLLGFNARSQNFIDTTKVWTVAEYITDGSHNTKYTISYSFNGDTLIDEQTYTKMFSFKNNEIKFHSLWREDDQGKVYFTRGTTKDYVLYDFQLKEGDTLNVHEDEMIVDSIRMKKFGEYDKKFIYSHYEGITDHVILWIEGVGSLNAPHISDDYFLVGGSYALICYHEGDNLIYLCPDYTACDASSGTSINNIEFQQSLIKVIMLNDLKIGIELNNNESGIFEMYSVSGKIICSQEITNQSESLCLPESGLYIYRFTNTNRKIQTGKIIVK